ncbi:MAG: hypothetical protein AAF999_02460 [Pseudomonadota bacterium]
MSNMENLEGQLNEKSRQEKRFQAAISRINTEKRLQEANGYAVMSAAFGYGEGALGGGKLAKFSHGAKLFCIGFAFLVPSLLMWRVVL